MITSFAMRDSNRHCAYALGPWTAGGVRAGVSDAACSSARHELVLGSPLLVSGRLYDAERTQPIHHQLDSNCGKQDPEHDLGDDQADGVQALGQLVDVGKDQVIDRADQQGEFQNQGGACERDDLAGRNDEDRDADSDQFARFFRSDVAWDSDFNSPTIPISNRPGKRFFQHVDFLTSVSSIGQPFLACLPLVRRRLSPASSTRWALWMRRSRMASA